jgi:nitrite reductase (NADH) small subunit
MRVCATHELPSGARRVIEINDYEEVLVLNVEGRLYAISNICPHQGAALARGVVEGEVLYCPLHRWGFTLTTGKCLEHAIMRVPLYTLESKDGDVLLHLP